MRDVNDRDFDDIVKQAAVPVLVEFWKPGCGSCRALMQELEKLELDVTGKALILKMNVEENFQIPAELEVHTLPVLASITRESSNGLSADWEPGRKFSSSYG